MMTGESLDAQAACWREAKRAHLPIWWPCPCSSIDHGVTQNPYERRFSPYDFNGGSVCLPRFSVSGTVILLAAEVG